ncbi:MAG: Crp/Fnr family transcriptional regulator [Chloroflexota bacterium]
MGDGRPSWSTESDVRAALVASPLGALPSPTIAALLVGARSVAASPGEVIQHEGVAGPHLSLVVDGLVRNVLRGADGRSLTVRYARRGALLGTLSLYGGRTCRQARPRPWSRRGCWCCARTWCGPPRTGTRSLPGRSSRTSPPASGSTSRRCRAAFGSVRQRVARHLLDLASERQQGPELVAAVTQQELADAVGSVREVVVRTLADLRTEGIVATHRGGIVIVAPGRLLEVLDPAPIV